MPTDLPVEASAVLALDAQRGALHETDGCDREAGEVEYATSIP